MIQILRDRGCYNHKSINVLIIIKLLRKLLLKGETSDFSLYNTTREKSPRRRRTTIRGAVSKSCTVDQLNQSIVSRWEIEIGVSAGRWWNASHPTENHRSSKHSTRRIIEFRRYLRPAICLANIFDARYLYAIYIIRGRRSTLGELLDDWFKGRTFH